LIAIFAYQNNVPMLRSLKAFIMGFAT